MAPASIIVVGAGIGGLTAALALADRGGPITLIERRTAFTEVGAGLQISPNAAHVLIGLGLGPALRRAATEPPRLLVRALRSGREIGGATLGAFARERFGAPYYVVHRADLQTLLLDAVRARPNVKILLGRAAVAVERGPEKVAVRIEKAAGASETVEGDLIVGADGLWSIIRGAVGDARRPAYSGYTAWRATIPRSGAPETLAGDETGLWLGAEGHVVHYPIGDNLLNIVAIERRTEPVEGWSAGGRRELLLAKFEGAAAPLRRLLSAPPQWLLWSLFELPAARMTSGRVALLGDAAHPVLPFLAQGAALAIEDAATLGKALADEPDIPKALRQYEHMRFGRARSVQRAARRNGAAYHAGPLKALLRDALIRRLGREGMTDRYAWLYGWRPG